MEHPQKEGNKAAEVSAALLIAAILFLLFYTMPPVHHAVNAAFNSAVAAVVSD